jgi:hypothetical protein
MDCWASRFVIFPINSLGLAKKKLSLFTRGACSMCHYHLECLDDDLAIVDSRKVYGSGRPAIEKKCPWRSTTPGSC